MSFQVDTALVQTYHSNLNIKFQQMGSRLRPYVRTETQNAEFDYYDRIGPTDAVEVTTRHGDTPLVSTPHDRRRVGLRDFDWADLIDRKDKIRMLADPTAPYTMNAIYALGRKMDDVVIAAATGTAYTGKTGATSTAFSVNQVMFADATDGSAFNGGGTGIGTAANGGTTTNLTLGKLRRARQLMDTQEVTTDSEYNIVGVFSPAMIWALMRDSVAGVAGTTSIVNPVVSTDYNAVRALANGQLDTFMGIRFVKSNRLLAGVSVSTVKMGLLFEQQGLVLAVGQEISADVGPRRDKRNSIQVYVSGSFGATRLWEEKIVQVNCDEIK